MDPAPISSESCPKVADGRIRLPFSRIPRRESNSPKATLRSRTRPLRSICKKCQYNRSKTSAQQHSNQEPRNCTYASDWCDSHFDVRSGLFQNVFVGVGDCLCCRKHGFEIDEVGPLHSPSENRRQARLKNSDPRNANLTFNHGAHTTSLHQIHFVCFTSR